MRGNPNTNRRTLAAGLVIGALAVAPVATAQSSQATGGGPAFTPSVTLMASVTRNPERLSGDDTRADFYAVVADLPFQLRGPRWSAQFAYQPGYQRFREGGVSTSLEHALRMSIDAQLSARTSLSVGGDAYVSNELRGLDATEVFVPRTRRGRAEIEGRLQHRLGMRDSIGISALYQRSDFLDRAGSGGDVFGVGLDYQRQITPRFWIGAGGAGRVARFESGADARSVTASGGFGYRIDEFTELEVEGGLLWVRQQDTGEFRAVSGSPGIALSALLTHRAGRIDLGLSASRDVGFTSGLGSATIRDRVLASIGTANHRWSLRGSGGFARNHLLATSGVSPSFSDPTAIDTVTGCFGGAMRLTRGVAVVGNALYAHQVGGVASELDVDTYRVALGVRLQMNPPPFGHASPGAAGPSAIGRSARASC